MAAILDFTTFPKEEFCAIFFGSSRHIYLQFWTKISLLTKMSRFAIFYVHFYWPITILA